MYTILDHSTVSEPETNQRWGVRSTPNIYILLLYTITTKTKKDFKSTAMSFLKLGVLYAS